MGKLTAVELAQSLARQVRYDLPIGDGNTDYNLVRTGKWSAVMALLSQSSDHFYEPAITTNNKITWALYPVEQTLPVLGFTSVNDKIHARKYILNKISKTLLTKAGNCTQMALIAELRFCEHVWNQLDETDTFLFERIILPGVNHELTKITLNGESALCDPWGHYADVFDQKNPAQYIFHISGILSPVEAQKLARHQHHISNALIFGNCGVYERPYQRITSREDAGRFLTLHEFTHCTQLKNWPRPESDYEAHKSNTQKCFMPLRNELMSHSNHNTQNGSELINPKMVNRKSNLG